MQNDSDFFSHERHIAFALLFVFSFALLVFCLLSAPRGKSFMRYSLGKYNSPAGSDYHSLPSSLLWVPGPVVVSGEPLAVWQGVTFTHRKSLK
jgi:hypothetical protein